MLRGYVLKESIIFYPSNCAVNVIGDWFLFIKPIHTRRNLLELEELAFILV
jgi:hypothetical protein